MTYYLYLIPAVLLSICLHEYAHGFVSYKLGDPTPKAEGRLSLNPLHHIDPMGALCMVLFKIGWAKPVMINPRYYRKPKLGIALVGLAGPMMNLITAIAGIFFMSMINAMATKGTLAVTTLVIAIYTFLDFFTTVSIYQALFNLIPLPPLDGSKILAYFLPDQVLAFYSRYDRYCMFILLACLYFNIVDVPLEAAFNFIYTNVSTLADLIFFGSNVAAI